MGMEYRYNISKIIVFGPPTEVLGRRREEKMNMDSQEYDAVTGKPIDQSYLEKGLPPFLAESIEQMVLAWKRKETEGYTDWDCDYCNLQSDINIAEVENLITSDQAWYLREKYLYLERPGELD